MNPTLVVFEVQQLRNEMPKFKAWHTYNVHFQVIEGTRSRIQVCQGIVIKRQGEGARETFTVHKHSFGVGVKRTFTLHSPNINHIEVMSICDVHLAKLYYIQVKTTKTAKGREKRRKTSGAPETSSTRPQYFRTN